MNIKDIFSSLRGRNDNDHILRTPYGNFNLAKGEDQTRVKHDIADWRRAWQAAINIDNPNRGPLYDIYRDTDADGHLSGCIRQREGFVMAKSFKIVDDKGEDKPELLDYFDHSWFKDFCLYVLDSVYWEHSLIELGDVVGDRYYRHSLRLRETHSPQACHS